MNNTQARTWFTVCCIMAVIGLAFAVFGLDILPVNAAALQDWSSAIYGSMMIGWAVTLAWVGRLGFDRNDATILRGCLIGLGAWLALEAVFSLVMHVWFNIGVDIGVFVLFAIPLTDRLRHIKRSTALGLPSRS